MHIAQRARHFAALILSVIVLFACGATTTVVQGGGGGSTPTAGTSATATPTTPPPPTPTATPNPGRYDGTWVDDAQGTNGAGELIITNSGPTASAQAYGVCGTKCDWGTNSATVGPFTLVLNFNLGGSSTAGLTIQLSNSDIKVVDVDSHFGTSTYYMHRASATEVKAFLYASAWINDDPHTNGIPELLISVLGTKINVHGYGACTPTYCDWGTLSGNYTSDPFKVNFSFYGGTLTHDLSLSLLNSAGSSLQVIDVGSSSGTNTYTFHKSSIA